MQISRILRPKHPIWVFSVTFIAHCLTAAVAVDTPAQLPPGVLAVETIEGQLPMVEIGGRVVFRDPTADDTLPPLRVLPSRSRYWLQDRHLDIVIQLDGHPIEDSSINARIVDTDGNTLATYDFTPPPANAFIFFPLIPEGLECGAEASLQVQWLHGDSITAEVIEPFRVESFPTNAAPTGSVPIRITNPAAIAQNGVPFTVGVPFPRGLLESTDQLQLLDEHGKPVPVQIDVRARWSKFGSIKWVLIDFSADLDGTPRELSLAYGPQQHDRDSHPLLAQLRLGSFPRITTETLRFDDGLWFDADGTGKFKKILEERALIGAYVEHEDGRIYRPDPDTPFTIEQDGSEKIVLRRDGWYRDADSGQVFCQYVTRYIIHRESPWIRVFHTWIFTGDGNRDRITGMGWEFPFAGQAQPQGFLSSFSPDGKWIDGEYLVQSSSSSFFVHADGKDQDFPGGRAVGVARATIGDTTLYFGTKDFWQNYPSELEFADNALWFHNWPAHNRPATVSYDLEALTEEELNRNTIRLLFAHQGETLDFRLPDEFAEDPIRTEISRGNEEASGHWDRHQPESANAQGISRTEEFWIYLTADAAPEGKSEKLLAALNDETLRAFADPAWIAASGAFYAMHPQDWENYPDEERAFLLTARTPALWQERLDIYGMWIYGDVATWGMNLGNQTASLYRTFRARHHGWPYSWLPYVRSGDPELLKYAEAATRQVTDASYCHYVSAEVDQLSGENRARRIGIWSRSLVPWTGRYHPRTRDYESKVDYLLYAYYLTDYRRAWDVMESWMGETRVQDYLSNRGIVTGGGNRQPRTHITLWKAYLDVWEATFDPWFLVAAHAFAEGNRGAYSQGVNTGHFWVPAIRDFHVFSGDDRILDLYFEYTHVWGAPSTASWSGTGGPMIESNAYAWELTGDPYYLRRVENFLDVPAKAVFDGPGPDYVQGQYTRGSSHAIFTGFYLNLFPTALAAIHAAGERSEPIPQPIFLNSNRDMRPGTTLPFAVPLIAVLKTDAEVSVPIRLSASSRTRTGEGTVEITTAGGDVILSESIGINSTRTIEIPADAPAGVYLVALEFPANTAIEIPLTPVDHPEVIVHDTSHSVFTSRPETSFWFKVPAGVETFSVELPIEGPTRRLSIWYPDGSPAWDLSYHPHFYDGPDPAILTFDPTANQQNKLWRITQFGSSLGFHLDAPIPQIFSTTPSRWFDPEEY